MISEAYINKLVKEWAKTPAGKAEIKKVTGKDYDEKFGLGKAREYGRRMQRILFEKINPIIKSIQLTDIVVGEPTIDDDGQTRLLISFKEGSLHRESLDSSRYPDGLNNIVLLFAKGYHANGSIHGTWHKPSGDVEVWSRRSREPNDFLYRAVADFNNMANGIAIAELDNKYKNNG